MKLALLPLGMALAVCSAAPLSAQSLATWDSPVNVTATAGALTKSGGCDGCPDSGAHSTAQITGDGYAEFVPAAGQRLYGGLGTDLSAATSSSTINYAFSVWPSGSFEIRELGVYKGEGTFAAGDRLRVAVEHGAVVYRKNGAIVYTSQVAPAYPLVFDTSLYSLGASFSGATVAAATTTTPTATTMPTTTASTGPVRTSAGPYLAVTDRIAYPKPALPVLGAAGSTFTDPVFTSAMTRVTDSLTRPGLPNRSYRTPSSPHQNGWSANGSYFYVVSGDGSIIPFSFDGTTGTAQRIQPTATGAGGLVLSFYIEPQFSYVSDSIVYGSVSGGNLHTIDQYDFSSGLYARILDLETIVSGLTGTYIGGVASSAGATERLMVMFGGASQDHHHLVLVFDRNNPSNHLLLDTTANTLNGAPTSSVLSFSLHHVAIDRSGRYLMLYPTGADQTGTRQAPQSVAWDTQTGVFTEMPVSSHPYGHDALGYGVSVNQDCCVTSTYDGVQWQFRSLSTPLTSRDVLPQALLPQEVYISDHSTWHNAQPAALLPFISGLFRYGTNNATPWRALDDEIVAVETDAPGQSPTIWRFAQHRSNVASDTDASLTSFWYEPRPNVSHDGRWVMFTSNWEKSLGTDPTGSAGSAARQDVFLVKLAASTSAAGGATTTTPTTTTTTTTPTTPTTAPPPPTPVAIASATLPAGRATVAYSAVLQATGGSGTFTWSVAAGALPAGLTLAASGAISGTPMAAGKASVTIAAADAATATNKATATYTLTIGASPVSISSNSLPTGRAKVAYAASLQAAGGAGTFSWTVAAGALPAGVMLGASTGALSGTPAAAGHWTFTIAVADATDASNASSASFSIDIAAPPVAITTATLPGVRATSAYSATLQATGGTGAYKWAVTGGALPSGLTLDAASGTISGAAQNAGTSAATVTATDAADATNAASAAFSITITAAPVTIATSSLAGGRATVAYAATLQATGGAGTYAWSITSGALPSGLTLNASTGAIAGTPAASATATVSVTVADAADATNTATGTYAIAIGNAPVHIGAATLPAGRLTVAYSTALTVAGGGGSYVWSVASGSLPAGLSLNAASGAIAGIPTAAGAVSFGVTVADAADATNSATAAYSIAVGASPVHVTTSALPAGRAKVFYSAAEQAAGGSGAFTWSIASGALPAGLTLNATTGSISGTPTSTATGTSVVTVNATDAADAANAGTATYTITISAAVKIVSPRTIPAATLGAPYTYQVIAVNIQGAANWDLAGGAMPPGITLDPSTGVISGTCATAGTWYFNVRVTDVSTTSTLTLGLTVQ